MRDKKNSRQLTQEREDEVVKGIDVGMEFVLSSKIKVKELGEKEINGVQLEKGMRFVVKKGYDLKKSQVRADDGIDIEGGKKFDFQEGDELRLLGIHIDKKEHHGKLELSIKRDSKTIKGKNDKDLKFVFSTESFFELFELIADIEITGISHFKFRKSDKIKIIETNTEGLKTVTFIVKRDGKRVKDSLGNELKFTFNALIFLKYFQTHSNIIEVVEETKGIIQDLVDDGKES